METEEQVEGREFESDNGSVKNLRGGYVEVHSNRMMGATILDQGEVDLLIEAALAGKISCQPLFTEVDWEEAAGSLERDIAYWRGRLAEAQERAELAKLNESVARARLDRAEDRIEALTEDLRSANKHAMKLEVVLEHAEGLLGA